MGSTRRYNTPSAFPFDEQKPQLGVNFKNAEAKIAKAKVFELEADRCINQEVAAAFRKAAAQLRAESLRTITRKTAKRTG